MNEAESSLFVDRAYDLSDNDIADLCDAAESAILDGGGFGWLKPPPRDLLERYWRGVLLVPGRELFVACYEGRAVGSAQLVSPPRNNEAQKGIATITTNFVAPWARGHGLARDLIVACEKSARRHGVRSLILMFGKLRMPLFNSTSHWDMSAGALIPTTQLSTGRQLSDTITPRPWRMALGKKDALNDFVSGN
jgi:predicted GNAT family acetyltransferase